MSIKWNTPLISPLSSTTRLRLNWWQNTVSPHGSIPEGRLPSSTRSGHGALPQLRRSTSTFRASALVLSHGHYDHSGAIPPVSRRQSVRTRHLRARRDDQQLHAALTNNRQRVGAATRFEHALELLPPNRLYRTRRTRATSARIRSPARFHEIPPSKTPAAPFYLDPDKSLSPTRSRRPLALVRNRRWSRHPHRLLPSGSLNTVREPQQISDADAHPRHRRPAPAQLRAGTAERHPRFPARMHARFPRALPAPAHKSSRLLRTEFGDTVVKAGGAGQTIAIPSPGSSC